jgi:hypothetical protein
LTEKASSLASGSSSLNARLDPSPVFAARRGPIRVLALATRGVLVGHAGSAHLNLLPSFLKESITAPLLASPRTVPKLMGL